MKLKSFGIVSLGCSKNLADSEVMFGALLKAGYQVAPTSEEADAVIINTCGFIESARAEGAEEILTACDRKAAGDCKAVIVTGCMPQRYREQMAETFPEVDAFLGVDQLDLIPEILQQLEKRSKKEAKQPLPVTIAPGLPVRTFNKPIPALRLTGPVFAYVKIAEGCNHACAFCAIPQFRGHLRSRKAADIVAEVKALLETGTREINLVAQDVTAYGRDLRDGTTLASLLKELDSLEGDFWLRFLYGFHNHVTDELLAVMANATHIVPYFDLPIQHCTPNVLRAMRRADTIAAIGSFPERLRSAVPGAVLRTTCMVGFPGETEADFEALMAYIERVRFDHLGTFIFCPEEGTHAATLDGLPDEKTAQRRHAALMTLQKRIARENNRARVGLEQRALVVDFDDADGIYVRLPHQAPEVDGLTHIAHAPETVQPGDFVNVRITGARGYDLTAKLI